VPERADWDGDRDQLQQLTAFSRHLCTDVQAATRVRSSGNAHEIVAIASDYGFTISVDLLRSKCWDLQGDHWPWARESGRWRLQFFREAQTESV
jgi:hypothetical protein